MKVKLTNTWKHAAVALAFSLLLIAVDWVVHALDPQAQFEMGWMSMFIFTGGALLWEAFYKSKNHIDTAVDLIVGIGVFTAVLWIGGLL